MNSEQPPPAKKPRRRAQAAVNGGGAIAQGNGVTAVGKGGQLVRGDIHNNFYPVAPSDAGAAELHQAYLNWLFTQANRLPLFVSDGKMVQLPAVYTALLTTASDDSRFPPAAAGAARQAGDGEPRQGERLSALEALDRERSLVLMGGPGSGKTTFLNFVALCLAGELLGSQTANLKLLRQPIPPEPDAAPADAKPQRQRWTHGALLPVCVVLRDFAASVPADAAVDAGTLWRFIVGQWPEPLRPYADPLQRELLGRGGLVLLDGLDEVPDALSRRKQVKEAVQAFAGLYGQCRFLVTSRTYAYQRQDWKLEGFAERELLPFTRGQIERFIDAWYAHMAKDLARLSASQAADGAARLKRAMQARHESKRRRVRDWQRWLLRSRCLPARERALAGDLLAALGDPRRELLDVDHLRFAFVPRGAFWMGDEGDSDAPLHRNETLDYDYWIAESPVTVAQFAQFVASTGGEAPDSQALRDPPNRPLATVSWHDALAFCAWLGERWRDRLPVGWSVALPSEAEWEKAARGGVELPVVAQYATVGQGLALADPARWKNPQAQRAWPWGDEWGLDRANTERIVGASSTPGCFEAGRSPTGCLDMAGNVWEWTRSLWGTDWLQPAFVYPYDARDRKREDLNAPEDVLRVVRGGSWRFHRDVARCAFRGWLLPGARDGSCGFRVVLRSSPVP